MSLFLIFPNWILTFLLVVLVSEVVLTWKFQWGNCEQRAARELKAIQLQQFYPKKTTTTKHSIDNWLYTTNYSKTTATTTTKRQLWQSRHQKFKYWLRSQGEKNKLLSWNAWMSYEGEVQIEMEIFNILDTLILVRHRYLETSCINVFIPYLSSVHQ